MRSDHLKRHMKKHVDLSSEDPEQICKSILEDLMIFPIKSQVKKKHQCTNVKTHILMD